MGKYEAEGGWWTHLRLAEPAVVRGIVGAIVLVGAIWGVDFAATGDKAIETYTIIFGALPLVQAFWTRTVVSPANGSTSEG